MFLYAGIVLQELLITKPNGGGFTGFSSTPWGLTSIVFCGSHPPECCHKLADAATDISAVTRGLGCMFVYVDVVPSLGRRI